jgi:WD40 repeat protein
MLCLSLAVLCACNPAATATSTAVNSAVATASSPPTQTPTPTPTLSATLTDPVAPTAVGAEMETPAVTVAARLNHLAWSPDGSILAAATTNGVRLLEAGSLRETGWLAEGAWISGLAFLPTRFGNLPRLVTLTQSGSLDVWDITDRKIVFSLGENTQPGASFTALALSPDDRWLAVGANDGIVRLWNLVSNKRVRVLEHLTGLVTSLDFSPDSHTLAAGAVSDCAANIVIAAWDVATGALREAPSGAPSTVNAVVYSPDGKVLASGGANGVVYLKPLAGGDGLELYGHTAEITALAYSPDGSRLASAGRDHAVFVWNTASGEQVRGLVGHADDVTSLGFEPGQGLLASGSVDGDVRLWEPDSGQLLQQALLFSPLAMAPAGCN